MSRERLCSDTQCLGDCTWCNRATIENPVITGPRRVSAPICLEAECQGDCTWCNRAESAPTPAPRLTSTSRTSAYVTSHGGLHA